MRRMHGLEEYGIELEAFVESSGLPQELFAQPDHIAIKCANELDYEETVRVFERTEEEINQVVMNGRKISTIRLAGSVSVGIFGKVEWLEVMEPRPERVGKDPVGIDHVEFFVTDLDVVQGLLEGSQLDWKPESNANHGWLTVVLNERGQEVKFTSTRLEEIVERNKRAGESHPRR